MSDATSKIPAFDKMIEMEDLLNEVPEHIRRAAVNSPEKPDQLAKARALAASARDIERQIADLEERTKEKKAQLTVITRETLPDLMDQAKIVKLELAPEGNEPGYEFRLAPFYSAGIAASWTEDKKREAYKYLESIGAGDLIKATITIYFAREEKAKADALAAELLNRDLEFETEVAVHASTLRSWLRETVEEGHDMPQLDKIGGFVGRQVTMKKVKT